MQVAVQQEMKDPTAMALATADERGHPDVRTVLLKYVVDDQLVFFTQKSSAKGKQLQRVPWAAALFYWPRLERQVRARGPVRLLPRSFAERYFHQRPRLSQISALISPQVSLCPIADFWKNALRRPFGNIRGKRFLYLESGRLTGCTSKSLNSGRGVLHASMIESAIAVLRKGGVLNG